MIPDQVTGPTASRAGVATARRTATNVLPTVSTTAAAHTRTSQRTPHVGDDPVELDQAVGHHGAETGDASDDQTGDGHERSLERAGRDDLATGRADQALLPELTAPIDDDRMRPCSRP